MITVVGSINMDLVIQTDRFPKQGETTLGTLYTTVPGGKGANQAVAAARLGNKVQMIGAVGQDAFGTELVAGLESEGIQVESIKRIDGASGIANILLSEGDNRIIVVPGANHSVTAEEIVAFTEQLAASDLVIMQLETPIPVIQQTLKICHQHGVPSILNPAPASGFTADFLPYCTYLTPNETEAEEIFGDNWEKALEEYPNRLVVTLGQKGAQFYDGQKHVLVKGFSTKAVDTTGAGDTFNGALGAALVEGQGFEEAVRFANAAASLSVEKFGAQGGMPNRAAVEARMTGERS
ncbi:MULTISPECIES: ribokinase [Planococcus]|uniref:Ribokinase n=1 Tax=Planococcus faecalis TaxID=1598147 RepID=A0ABM6IVX2_9BACL|nr:MULTISPECIES: ribokinase [Planococcus]AQU80477.1 ribokinase [Planococcus faecalis]MDJ0330220.1 ribokinase [Planococcus sp. S3-L1]OHX54774.1 ribokinase [Planococcus faecalis]